MAILDPSSHPRTLHRFPQPNYVDAVRWLPPLSALRRHAAVALFDHESSSSTLQIYSLNSSTKTLTLTPPKSPILTLPSRIASLRTAISVHSHKPLLALSTSAGSLHFLAVGADADSDSIEAEVSVPVIAGLGRGGGAMDLMEGGGAECVAAGEDGRVSVVRVGENGEPEWRTVFDGCGLVSYTAAKWASPAEFATGGMGFGMQWWDLRRAGSAVSQFKGGWGQRRTSGIVHSIDIHPSRKHTCLAGGSLGTVFAWDIRWPQQPIILSGVGAGETGAHSPSESEVWEVQYERHTKVTNTGSISSSKILPAMMCSEDGILAVVEQGEEPLELLAEPCAINSFDIDRNNPLDVICSFEWESIAILTRP